MERVEVWRGRHGDPVPLFGPLPGVRVDDTLAYEYELAPRLASWPGRTRIDRSFVLLDLGVSMALPACQRGRVWRWRRKRFSNSGTTRTSSYDVAAALMSLGLHERGSHVV